MQNLPRSVYNEPNEKDDKKVMGIPKHFKVASPVKK